MGLGKTVQTVSFLSWLMHEHDRHGPFLVVVPLSTLPAWAETFDNWAPDMNVVVYSGHKDGRAMMRDYEFFVDGSNKRTKFNVLLTTYEMASVDRAFLETIKWQNLAVDEAHRLKNAEAALYGILDRFKTASRLLITGTPIQNNMSELRALFDFLNPGLLDDINNFDINEASDNTEEAAKLIENIRQATSPYMLRRVKAQVETSMPGKTEKIIRVELSDEQTHYYKNIITRNYDALNAGSNAAKVSLLNIVMELKKASNHPFIFDGAEERLLQGKEDRHSVLRTMIMTSGKMVLLDKLLMKLKKDNHRVLIFSQMVAMLDIIARYLNLRGLSFQRIDGTVHSSIRRSSIDHFNSPGSTDFCFLLSTRAGGLGINLMTADTVILFDSDWNPQADLQAMARAHRIGQKNHVMVYRLVSKDTIEEEILERARDKMILEHLIMTTGSSDKKYKKKLQQNLGDASSDQLSKLLKARAKKMFEANDNQKKLEELNIDDMLEHAEDHVTKVGELMADGGKAFLDQFNVTDVAMNFEDDTEWDAIIPKEELEAIREAEKKRKEEEFLKKQIEESSGRKRKAVQSESRSERRAKRQAKTNVSEDSELSSPESDEEDTKKAWGEKQIRNLYKAIGKFGSLDDRFEDIVKEAKLTSYDPEILRETVKKLNDIANEALEKHAEIVAANPTPTNMKKAVLFDYEGVKGINAGVLIQRPPLLKILRRFLQAHKDPTTFRVAEVKAVPNTWSCTWGSKEDGMLMVGIDRHGYGNWVAIRDDEQLGLKEKFFLEEHRIEKKEERLKQLAQKDGKNGGKNYLKAPGSMHLQRRADYLLTTLQERYKTKMEHKPAVIRANKAKPSPKMGARPNNISRNTSHSKVDREGKGKTPVKSNPATPDARQRPSNKSKKSDDGYFSRGGDKEKGREREKDKKVRIDRDVVLPSGLSSADHRHLTKLRPHLVKIADCLKVPDRANLAILKEELYHVGEYVSQRKKHSDPKAFW